MKKQLELNAAIKRYSIGKLHWLIGWLDVFKWKIALVNWLVGWFVVSFVG